MKIFLMVNAGLYFALAGLCTVRHLQTLRGLGYVQLDAAGHSEYLVIYGGLQLGLALFYLLLARQPQYFPLGLTFSLLFYAPIVIYRVATLLIYRPTNPVTLGTAALEVALLIWAAILKWKTAG